MALYRISLAYDGTDYRGWQVQPAGPTIQGRIEAVLERIDRRPVRVVGAGRTDAGVHAAGQVAHFELAAGLDPAALQRAMNAMLPADIRVLDAALAPPGFHARYAARAKTYRYYLGLAPVASPFRRRYVLHCPRPLDVAAMRRAAARFVGRRDFAALRAAGSDARTTVREVLASAFVEQGDELVYEVTATGFLRHMVRNIVGTLLEVGRGKREPETIDALLDSRDRTRAGPTAPAHGLHLHRVDY